MSLKPCISLVFFAAFLALGGCAGCGLFCGDATDVQKTYIADRNECREVSDLKLDFYMKPEEAAGDPKTKNAILVTLFKQCMIGKSWDMGAVDESALKKRPKQLRNVGVGIGSGPSYHLEYVPAPEGETPANNQNAAKDGAALPTAPAAPESAKKEETAPPVPSPVPSPLRALPAVEEEPWPLPDIEPLPKKY